MSNRTMGVTEWALLVVLSLLWGSVFLLIEVALTDLGPFSLVLGRVGLGALVLLGYVYLSGARMPADGRVWAVFFVMGALNNVIPFSLIAWGQLAIDSGMAAILNATTPLFAVALAHFLTADERMTAHRLLGVLLGFCGVVLLVGPEALRGFSVQGFGQLAILGAAFSYACAGIHGRRLRGVSPSVAAAGMLIAATVTMAPLALVVERPWTARPGALAVAAVVGLAVFCTALAYIIYFRILAAQAEGRDSSEVRPQVMEMVRRAFRPEFLNRLDEIILFHRLFREHMTGIVDIQLGRLKGLLAERKIKLALDKAAKAWLADKGYDAVYGARPLKRVIQRALQNPLAGLILEGKVLDGADVKVSAGSGGLTINGKAVEAEAA